MANYLFNDSRNNDGNNAVLFSIGAADRITFGANAFWSAINGTALSMTSGAIVTVNGQLYANIGITVSSTGNRIIVGTSGIVSGFSYGIDAGTIAGTTLQNFGVITGATAARIGVGTDVINDGVIAGASTGLSGTLSFVTRITNSGSISGPNAAISLSGGQPVTIDNSGEISSTFAAITVSGQTAFGTAIRNSGLISGGIQLFNAGPSDIQNSGTISGDVSLGSRDDVLDTSAGHLYGTVSAGSGNDTLIGSAERDIFLGSDGDDELYGNASDDRLSGGPGADLLDGGDGFDFAVYTGTDFAVTVDLVDPSRNRGDAAGDTYVSIEGIVGNYTSDFLYGDANANRLIGSGGDDWLDGRGGADVLLGGTGNDTYVVDHARDRVIELGKEGDDLVQSRVSYALPDNVERLTLIGTAAINGSGNALANIIIGNAGANRLDGGEGNDIMTGGAGTDTFAFTGVKVGEIDTITDFAPGSDRLELSRSIFTALNGGTALRAAAFTTGTTATDALDRIIYDPTTGDLFYDIDGNGAEAQILFARLTNMPTLSVTDFVLVP